MGVTCSKQGYVQENLKGRDHSEDFGVTGRFRTGISRGFFYVGFGK
jgi:hypothetical protein